MRLWIRLSFILLGILVILPATAATSLADCHDKYVQCRLEPNFDSRSVGKVSYSRCWDWKKAMCQHCRSGGSIAEKCRQFQKCKDRPNGCWVGFWDNLFHTESSWYSSAGLSRPGG